MKRDWKEIPTWIPRIKKADLDELQEIAEEIRQRIIRVVTDHGGHLASNLGTIELTIALYRSFDFPQEDKLVWDTGHQSYAHKIITGRDNRFDSLRTLDGISGFTNIFESPFDSFGAGHVGTAIGAALGFEVAKRRSLQPGNVIAVVGDGALTSGPSLEALNLAAQLKSNLRVIINDNGMSIHESVGALAKSFNLLRTSAGYAGMKDRMKSFFKTTHLDGIESGLERIRDAFKHTILPQNTFENMGWKYIGPIDGHDLEFLIALMDNLKKDYERPTIIHIHTCKGKGYEEAERNPTYFHGIGKLDPQEDTTQKAPRMGYNETLGKTLGIWAQKDPKLVAITAAMEEGTGLGLFKSEFPDRFYDLGITESLCTLFSGALALEDHHPVFAVYSTFLQRAYDQLIHDIALQKLPVLFCVDRAGLVGEDGPTHHGVFDIAYTLSIPGARVYAPSSLNQFIRMLGYLHQQNWHVDGPVFMRYPRKEEAIPALSIESLFNTPKAPEDWEVYPGVGPLVGQSAHNAVIFAVGSMVPVALEAQQNLPIPVTVVDSCCVKPLDWKTIQQVIDQTHPSFLFTLEEGIEIGGFGQYLISELMARNRSVFSSIPVMRSFGISDAFVPHGKRDELLDLVGLSTEKLVGRMEKVIRQYVGDEAYSLVLGDQDD